MDTIEYNGERYNIYPDIKDALTVWRNLRRTGFINVAVIDASFHSKKTGYFVVSNSGVVYAKR